uniref:lysozyme n=1 Tax=Coptotermes formosanus TaxID=36987 RepID=L0AUF5_COPFO|nr:C-type lysozyme-3 [Coptotermes formosanus]
MELRNSPMLLIAVLFLCTVHITTARVLTPCQIARELYEHGIRREQLNDWVCLVMSESSGNTHAINTQNSDGSYDYGLFQINSRYWCGQHGPGGACNIACSELLSDNISVAVNCAKKIYGVHRFDAWEGWKQKCRGRSLQDVTRCLYQLQCGCGQNYPF